MDISQVQGYNFRRSSIKRFFDSQRIIKFHFFFVKISLKTSLESYAAKTIFVSQACAINIIHRFPFQGFRSCPWKKFIIINVCFSDNLRSKKNYNDHIFKIILTPGRDPRQKWNQFVLRKISHKNLYKIVPCYVKSDTNYNYYFIINYNIDSTTSCAIGPRDVSEKLLSVIGETNLRDLMAHKLEESINS